MLKRLVFCLLFLVPVLIIVTTRYVVAHDGIYDSWMNKLKQRNGISCCDLTDCFITRARSGAEGWEALTKDNVWVKVPDDTIIRDKGNPTGQPVLCFNHGRVLCFVEPIGA